MHFKKILVLLSFFYATSAFSLSNECGENSSIDGTGYLLAPSGKDDSTNLACVFNSAINQGITNIKLERGDFKISSLEVTGFEGKFEGTNRNDTKLIIANNSLSCGDNFGEAPSLITFIGGSVSINKMTIDVDRPCERADTYSVLEFVQASCTARTHFANVDRVDFVGPGIDIDDLTRAIAFIGKPECVEEGKGPLGTFKLNRSSINGFVYGVTTGLLGAGQVDINFNEFSNVLVAIETQNANQSTTITGNEIGYIVYGVMAFSDQEYAPSQHRVVVHSNSFKQSEIGSSAYAVIVFTEAVRTSISTVISNNSFELIDRQSADSSQVGIGIFDVDNAVVINNSFEGDATVGIYVDSYRFEKSAENTTVIGNNFNQKNSLEDWDILLGEGADYSVIGKQGAITEDRGYQNRKL